MEGMLCLLIGVRSIPLIRSRHKNCPYHMSHDLIKYRGRHSPKDLLKRVVAPGWEPNIVGPKT
jgi:hypothetical protein